jgi:hypothetical protein
MLVQVTALITRQTLRRGERRKQEFHRQAVAQIQSIQRDVFRQIHFSFLERHGQLEGSRLAQLTVDRLFGRPNSIRGYESFVAEQFAARIATENRDIRNAAFISLLRMLEVESADHTASTRRGIEDTLHWLEQFGEVPPSAADPDALDRISENLSDRQESEETVLPTASLRSLPLISSVA